MVRGCVFLTHSRGLTHAISAWLCVGSRHSNSRTSLSKALPRINLRSPTNSLQPLCCIYLSRLVCLSAYACLFVCLVVHLLAASCFMTCLHCAFVLLARAALVCTNVCCIGWFARLVESREYRVVLVWLCV